MAKQTRRLSEIEASVLRVRYGLGGRKDIYSRAEAADYFKTTPDGIRNIERRAIDKIRVMFIADE